MIRKFVIILKQYMLLNLMAKRAGVGNLISMLNIFESKQGHFRSLREKMSVNSEGAPLPWYTYPAIEYLRQFDWSQKTIFEFSSGNGSLFWADRCKSIISVENDQKWYEKMKSLTRPNQKILFIESPDEYVNSIKMINNLFDVVVVDGIERLKCAEVALKCLTPGGIVIVDNSDWYPGIASKLRESGFIQVDFAGIGPINYYSWTTSIFFDREVQMMPLGRCPEYAIGGTQCTYA